MTSVGWEHHDHLYQGEDDNPHRSEEQDDNHNGGDVEFYQVMVAKDVGQTLDFASSKFTKVPTFKIMMI